MLQRRGGFTVVELMALAAAGAVGLASMVAMTAEPPPGRRVSTEEEASPLASLSQARAQARALKDATQIRGIDQSFIIWAQNNKSVYPLPSKIDTENKTVAVEGRAKDTTANIFSMLIFNGSISTELCVSPAEVNKKIKVYETYEFTNPKAAVNGPEALWDPAFRCDFLRQPGGNVSYAHLQTSDSRLPMWSDTFSSTEAVVGNRGPAIAEAGVDEAGQPTTRLRKEKSKTFRIHGSQGSWEGNVAYNDGHVNLETRYTPDGVMYTASTGDAAKAAVKTDGPTQKSKPDNLFFDEKDAVDGKNLYLGIWRRAGAKPEEFGGIWD
jgi:prepilin-type processing-associated H-X9-DG protein